MGRTRRRRCPALLPTTVSLTALYAFGVHADARAMAAAARVRE
jgi:hypothetical protein